ncbi:MAG TPA: 7-cyano-7-deazaguanine synthase QueC [Waddliaceae bacterium]
MKAVILLSGGLDSAVVLALALEKGRECFALSFDYQQRHIKELQSAQQIAAYYKIPHRVITIDPTPFSSSALVSEKSIIKNRTFEEIAISEIPNTYVPARNTLFMAYALGLAEVLNAQEIYIGSNALDHRPYPDCRPEFFEALQKLFRLATKQAVEGAPPIPVAPLLCWNKAEIVQEGRRLKVPLELTFSCYDPTPEGMHCCRCDACQLRFEALESVQNL